MDSNEYMFDHNSGSIVHRGEFALKEENEKLKKENAELKEQVAKLQGKIDLVIAKINKATCGTPHNDRPCPNDAH